MHTRIARLRRRLYPLLPLVPLLPLLLLAAQTQTPPTNFAIENDVLIAMRDGVKLQADVWRPKDDAKHAVLVYRTPYNRKRSPEEATTFRKAVERGYAVVMQDVRGRYGSEGEFNPYFQEGRDGYDTIEWAAAQPWSDGNVGTFGLSYPGAVQWLAAIENPPHLKAMVPAMTFSTPRNFIYSGGVFDGSWVAWIWDNIAPDARVRKNLPGPRTGREARQAEAEALAKIRSVLPLSAMTEFREIAPWYYEWLKHEPQDKYWDALDLRNKYSRTNAAVLNFSGWYDEAYGPEGATTNFAGLLAARKGAADPRTKLVIGPWPHGIPRRDADKAGEREFGPAAIIDYDEMVLRWMDKYARGLDNGVEREPRVRMFVMQRNRWLETNTWPIPNLKNVSYFLYAPNDAKGRTGGQLLRSLPQLPGRVGTTFDSDPTHPLTDPFPAYSGGHDYSAMAARDDVAVFETAPLEEDIVAVGKIKAEIHMSCDALDTDLWLKILDVEPDGHAINLMSPGLDVVRASYRTGRAHIPLEPTRVYLLEFPNLMTGNLFKKGHRIRIQFSAAFFPHFSRNLHTGKLETTQSSEMRKAKITILHGNTPNTISKIVLPIVPQ